MMQERERLLSVQRGRGHEQFTVAHPFNTSLFAASQALLTRTHSLGGSLQQTTHLIVLLWKLRQLPPKVQSFQPANLETSKPG